MGGGQDPRDGAIVGQVLWCCATSGPPIPDARTSYVSTLQLTLESVPGVHQVAELLRKLVQVARKQTGVSYHDRL